MQDSILFSKITSLPKDLQLQVARYVEELMGKSSLKKIASSTKMRIGLAKGKISIADSFDDPLEEFDSYQ